jgi:hypothetical protein
MKYQVTFPIIVDTNAPNTKKPQKTVLTRTTLVDVPFLNESSSNVELVLTYASADKRGDVSIIRTDKCFYQLLETSGNDVHATNQTLVKEAITTHLSNYCSSELERLKQEGAYTIKVEGKSIKDCPSVEGYLDKRLSLQSLEQADHQVQQELSANFCIYSGRLYQMIEEPRYFLFPIGAYATNYLLALSNSGFSDHPEAIFRVGRLKDAIEYGEMIASSKNGSFSVAHNELQELHGAYSSHDDVSETLWMQLRGAVNRMNNINPTDYIPSLRKTIQEIIWEMPTADLELIREIRDFINPIPRHEAYMWRERLTQLAEELVFLGSNSSLAKNFNHLETFLEMAENQTISLEHPKRTSPSR